MDEKESIQTFRIQETTSQASLQVQSAHLFSISSTNLCSFEFPAHPSSLKPTTTMPTPTIISGKQDRPRDKMRNSKHLHRRVQYLLEESCLKEGPRVRLYQRSGWGAVLGSSLSLAIFFSFWVSERGSRRRTCPLLLRPAQSSRRSESETTQIGPTTSCPHVAKGLASHRMPSAALPLVGEVEEEKRVGEDKGFSQVGKKLEKDGEPINYSWDRSST